MQKKFLITTAMEKTWKYDQPSLFLGNWCKIYSEKNIWNKLNHQTLSYHWDDVQKLQKDYIYLKNLSEKIIKNLVQVLNEIHDEKYSEKYWKIYLGHWLNCFIQILFDRWEIVQKAFSENAFSNTIVLKINVSEMVPLGIENFIDIIHQDKWNHFIFSKIIETIPFKNAINIEYIDDLKNDNYVRVKLHRKNLNRRIIVFLSNIFNPLIKLVRKNEKYLICESYLGKFSEMKLNLSLGLFPLSLSPDQIFLCEPNKELRNKIKFNFEAENNFEKFLRKIIPTLIPMSYLENYKKISNATSKLNWPKKPEAIFTSHFINNKTIPSKYTAEKKENGTKLIHGQHGGAYGQCLFHWYEEFERDISDFYLTWGWEDNKDKKLIPFGILKPINIYKKIKKIKKKTKLLFVIRPKERYSATALDSRVRSHQLLEYHQNCLKIARKLNFKIRSENLVIRLHERKYGWCEEELWSDEFPEITIDKGYKPIIEILKKTKLVVYTYNATGYLELLAANIPVIIFCPTDKNPLREQAIPYFEELKKSKIFHETTESVSEHLNKIWNEIDEWWNKKDVQNVRKKFCQKYAKYDSKKIENLKNIILNTGKTYN